MTPTTTQPVTIRPMTEAERPDALEQATLVYEEELKRAGAYAPDAARAKALVDMADYPPNSVPFVVEVDGRKVGTILLGMREKYGCAFGYVYGLYIVPGERGKGYGRAAIRRAELELSDRGATEIQLRVWGDNHAALRLYEQLGFKMTSLQMRKVLS